jgi:hypothetical protein
MVLDVVQLVALAVVIAGIWLAALATAAVGVATVLTGLVVLAVALAVEHRVT